MNKIVLGSGEKLSLTLLYAPELGSSAPAESVFASACRPDASGFEPRQSEADSDVAPTQSSAALHGSAFQIAAAPGIALRQSGADSGMVVRMTGDLSIEVDLDGEGAELDLAGLYLCNGSDNARLSVLVRHNAPGCSSRQLFKGTASGESHFEFDGLIYVARDAQKTKALQENHSLLLSPGAVVQTQPQLEIYADDVECSHGATIGSLSEAEQFYMRSRGIPETEARRLQMISFISEVATRFDEPLQEKIYSLL